MGICGCVRKEEAESNLFKREFASHIIQTPLGEIAVGICFDSHKSCFYNGIKDHRPFVILMPYAWTMSVDKTGNVKPENVTKIDFLCQTYADAFGVPVLFVNAQGSVEQMAGITGKLMKDYQLKGQSGIYRRDAQPIKFGGQELSLADIPIVEPDGRQQEIPFYDGFIDRGSGLFRKLVLPLDIKKGIREYEWKKRKISGETEVLD